MKEALQDMLLLVWAVNVVWYILRSCKKAENCFGSIQQLHFHAFHRRVGMAFCIVCLVAPMRLFGMAQGGLEIALSTFLVLSNLWLLHVHYLVNKPYRLTIFQL